MLPFSSNFANPPAYTQFDPNSSSNKDVVLRSGEFVRNVMTRVASAVASPQTAPARKQSINRLHSQFLQNPTIYSVPSSQDVINEADKTKHLALNLIGQAVSIQQASSIQSNSEIHYKTVDELGKYKIRLLSGSGVIALVM